MVERACTLPGRVGDGEKMENVNTDSRMKKAEPGMLMAWIQKLSPSPLGGHLVLKSPPG